MENDKKKKQRMFLLRVLLICGTLVLMVAYMGLFFPYLNRTLYEERAYHTLHTTSQITRTLEYVIDSNWRILEMVSMKIQEKEFESINELQEALQEFETDLQHEEVIFGISANDGITHLSDGNSLKVPNEEMLNKNRPYKQTAIIKHYPGETSERIYYLHRLQTPIVLKDETTIEYISSSYPVSQYEDLFRLSVFNQEKVAYIINEDGLVLYRNDLEEIPFDINHVWESLSEFEYLQGDDMEELFQKTNDRQVTCSQVRINGEHYFLTIQPMKYNNWSCLFLIPEEYVSANTTYFANSILYVSIASSILLGVLFFFTFFLLWKLFSQTARMRQEKRISLELTNASMQTQKALELKTEFLSHMASDFRTPLEKIRREVERIKEGRGDRNINRTPFTNIRNTAGFLLWNVNNILDMGRLEANHDLPGSRSAFKLHEMIETSIAPFEELIAQKNILFEYECHPVEDDYVCMNENYIRSIIGQLLDNAVKFTMKGQIHLTLSETVKKNNRLLVTIMISDTGVGIPKEEINELCHPFYQCMRADSDEVAGEGLGIPIVNQICQLLDGTLKIESDGKTGTTVTVTFSERLLNEKEYDAHRKKRENLISLKGMHVLLVDDNDINLMIAGMYLKDLEVSFETAMDGLEAIRVFENSKEGHFHAILMDITMPNIDGLESSKRIRGLNRKDAKTIPIIAQTANIYSEDVKRAKEAMMNDYIKKPLELSELSNVLQKYYVP